MGPVQWAPHIGFQPHACEETFLFPRVSLFWGFSAVWPFFLGFCFRRVLWGSGPCSFLPGIRQEDHKSVAYSRPILQQRMATVLGQLRHSGVYTHSLSQGSTVGCSFSWVFLCFGFGPLEMILQIG